MTGPPSVAFPVGPSRFAGWCFGIPWLAGLASWAAWCACVDGIGARQLVGAIAVVASGASGWWSLRAAPAGLLTWNGSEWSWQTGRHPAMPVALSLACDLQRVLLVLLRTQPSGRPWRRGGSIWLWLERGAGDDAWWALRRAVYAARGRAAMPVVDAANR